MERCKYLLPCGRCDKRGAPCDATAKQLEIYDSLESPEECEHEWRYHGCDTVGHSGHYYVCMKCGAMKSVPLENVDTGIFSASCYPDNMEELNDLSFIESKVDNVHSNAEGITL